MSFISEGEKVGFHVGGRGRYRVGVVVKRWWDENQRGRVNVLEDGTDREFQIYETCVTRRLGRNANVTNTRKHRDRFVSSSVPVDRGRGVVRDFVVDDCA